MSILPARLGIMADSHGEAGLIRRAIKMLARRQCRGWIHLGDICDADRPETARACMDLLATPQARILCGNNENGLRLNQGERLAADLRSRLALLPLTLKIDNVILAHSRPFADRLGASCTLGTMDRDAARTFFRRYPGCHLIRGHGHQPESIQWGGSRRHDAPPASGGVYRLEAGRPRILTCGALIEGWLMIWDRVAAEVQYLRLE